MLLNIYEAKTNLSKIVQSLETGAEKEVIICNRGKPVVRCTPISVFDENKRPFGIQKDNYKASDSDFFELDEEIAKEFTGD